MNPMNNHIVLDISSNKDDGKGENFSNWVDRSLEVSDEKPKSSTHQNSYSLDPTVEIKDDEDDCVILDGDPMAKETTIGACETDEVLVTGVKGEIACRDFPHPRHDCAKYSFKSTSHLKCCEMCYCYVCDTRAPCLHWCSGLSTIGHCHANDKDEIWKNQRELIRAGKMVPQPVLIPQNSSSPVTQFGVQACSTSTKVATHPSTEQSRTFMQKSVSQPRTAHSFRGGSYNGKQSPKRAVSYNPYKWTQRTSRGIYHPGNSLLNTAQGLEATLYTPPLLASQATSYVPPATLQAVYNAHPYVASQAIPYGFPVVPQAAHNAPHVASQATYYAPPMASQASCPLCSTLGFTSNMSCFFPGLPR